MRNRTAFDPAVTDCRKLFPPLTAITARDVSYDPSNCSNLKGTSNVQQALDVLCQGTGGEDGYSAFSVRDPRSGEAWETTLGIELRERLIKRLVVCGLATDYSVVETVSDARARHLDVDVMTSAIRAVDLRDGDGDRAVQRMRDVGALLL